MRWQPVAKLATLTLVRRTTKSASRHRARGEIEEKGSRLILAYLGQSPYASCTLQA